MKIIEEASGGFDIIGIMTVGLLGVAFYFDDCFILKSSSLGNCQGLFFRFRGEGRYIIALVLKKKTTADRCGQDGDDKQGCQTFLINTRYLESYGQ